MSRSRLQSAALREVTTKSDARIERETAHKWAARAVASMRRYRETGDARWALRAQSYSDEALEHAALARDGGKLVGQIERRLAAARRAGGR